MRAALLVTSLMLGLGLHARAETIELAHPAEIILFVVAPKAVAVATGSAALLEAAESSLKQAAFARLRSVEQSGVEAKRLDSCSARSRLACWADRVSSQAPDAKALLVLSVQPRPDGVDVLTAQFIDLAQAKRSRVLSAGQNDADRGDWLEEEMFRNTLRHGPSPVADKGARHTFFKEAFEHWKDALQAAGVPSPQSILRINTEIPIEVVLDSGDARVFPVGEHELRGLAPTTKKLRVVEPPLEYTLTLAPGATSTLLIEAPATSLAWVRTAALWGGASLAAAGTTAAIVGAARSGDGVRVGCIEGTGNCRGLGTPSVNYNPGGAPSIGADAVEPGGLRIVPFGAALIATGIIWVIGTFFDGEEDQPPWISLASGLAVGGVTYGLLHVGMR